jgi:peptidoglycan/xylan/chitin deacetylase (PgdA/CDA1 family)
MRKSKAILTFDLEFWYNSKFLKKYLPENKNQLDDCVEKPTELLLDLLKKYNQRATFFVLGRVAEKYPNLIKKISDLKHEIASHGYSHKSLWELTEEGFEKEIELSKKIIKNIINKEPKGFRAPNFSLNKKTKWALEVIKNNFKYDSSVHPLNLFRIKSQILEIYPSLGSIYFRILPLWLYCFLIKYFSKNRIPVLYFHLQDFFEFIPKIKAPWLKRKIKYWGLKNSWKKFEKLIEKFNFISIEQYFWNK